MAFNHSEVAHRWAHQVPLGKAGDRSAAGFNMFYEREIIYSYGSHFPLARLITLDRGAPGGSRGKRLPISVILVAAKTPSVSTAKHKTIALRACTHFQTFHVPSVMASDPISHKVNAEHILKRAEAGMAQAMRRRLPDLAECDLREVNNDCEKYERYCRYFRIRRRKLREPKGFQDWREGQHVTAGGHRAGPLTPERRDAMLADWRGHHRGMISSSLLEGFDYLRLSRTGQRIETTGGAWFPLDDAKTAFGILSRINTKAAGDVAVDMAVGHRIKLGHYEITAMARDHVVAGCHKVLFTEIKRMGEEIGL